jgi:hypothetical protein
MQGSSVEQRTGEESPRIESSMASELVLSQLRAENSRLSLKLKAGSDETKR